MHCFVCLSAKKNARGFKRQMCDDALVVFPLLHSTADAKSKPTYVRAMFDAVFANAAVIRHITHRLAHRMLLRIEYFKNE